MKVGTSRTCLIPILTALLIQPALAQEGIGIVGPSDRADSAVQIHENVVVIPEAAKLRYATGQAPLYVRVNVYARRIALLDPEDAGQLHADEARLLGISLDQLVLLSDLLGKFQTQDQLAVRAAKTRECTSVLLNGTDPASARETLLRLGDKTTTSNTIAQALLDEVEAEFGSEVAVNVRSRIEDTAKGIMFTKVDMKKFVETTAGGDYQKYLIDECNSI